MDYGVCHRPRYFIDIEYRANCVIILIYHYYLPLKPPGKKTIHSTTSRHTAILVSPSNSSTGIPCVIPSSSSIPLFQLYDYGVRLKLGSWDLNDPSSLKRRALVRQTWQV